MINGNDNQLKKLREVELEILDEITKICQNNDIVWWLDSGTALGARRHKGFIPWDDDIDIGMLRKDYEKFCKVAPQELSENFTFHNAKTEDTFAPLFSKVWKEGTEFVTQETLDANCKQGIFVDIFPYDYVDNSKYGKKIRNKMVYAQRLSYLYHSSHIKVPNKGFVGILQKKCCWLLHYLVRFFYTRKKIISIFEKACATFDSSRTIISSAYAYGDPIPFDWMIPTRSIEFEDRILPCPGQIDKYLTNRYGDWKKLPPEEDRVTHLPVSIKY